MGADSGPIGQSRTGGFPMVVFYLEYLNILQGTKTHYYNFWLTLCLYGDSIFHIGKPNHCISIVMYSRYW